MQPYHQQQPGAAAAGWPPPQPPPAPTAHQHMQPPPGWGPQQQQQQQQQQQHVPPPPQRQHRLRAVDELPPCFRAAFPSFRYFNAIQSACFDAAYGSPVNMVVAAPTGGGKTAVLELAVLRMLAPCVDGAGRFAPRRGRLKAVYVAPSRALVAERAADWRARLGDALGLLVAEATGDAGDGDGALAARLADADVVAATPEKLDALTRRRGGLGWLADVALLLVDEVHLLGEPRGAALEAGVVARLRLVAGKPEMAGHPVARLRLVAVSATVPNVADIAAWLRAPPAGVKAFGEEMRPVPLVTHVRAYPPARNDFLWDRRLGEHVYGVVADAAGGRPALVFCPSRKGAEETARRVAADAARAAARGAASALHRDAAHAARLAAAAAPLPPALRAAVAAGAGFHHAAMPPAERAAVEALFRGRDLPVLCTTSTLAQGVNLPARLVVVKGTRRWAGAGGGYEELERSAVLQMVGRAGRPGLDDAGVAVVMTTRDAAPRYAALVGGAEPVESRLAPVLAEALNAEVALRTVGDLPSAAAWLRSTFFAARAAAEPGRYGAPPAAAAGGAALDRWLTDTVLAGAVRALVDGGFAAAGGAGPGSLAPLEPGAIAAETYVRLPTMAAAAAVRPGGGAPDLLRALAGAAELADVRLRRGEKGPLVAVNKAGGLRFPLVAAAHPDRPADRVASAQDKLYILLGAGLAGGGHPRLDYALRQDMEAALAAGGRVASAMARLYAHAGRAAEAHAALLLAKGLRARMWDGAPDEARQVPGVGAATAARLVAAGAGRLRDLAALAPRALEALAQRPFPFGTEVAAALRRLLPPEVELGCGAAWAGGGAAELRVRVVRKAGAAAGGAAGGAPAARSNARLLVGSLHDNALLACRPLALEAFDSPLEFSVRTRSAPPRGADLTVVVALVHDRVVGLDAAIQTTLRPGSGAPAPRPTEPAPTAAEPAAQLLPAAAPAAEVAAAVPPPASAAAPPPPRLPKKRLPALQLQPAEQAPAPEPAPEAAPFLPPPPPPPLQLAPVAAPPAPPRAAAPALPPAALLAPAAAATPKKPSPLLLGARLGVQPLRSTAKRAAAPAAAAKSRLATARAPAPTAAAPPPPPVAAAAHEDRESAQSEQGLLPFERFRFVAGPPAASPPAARAALARAPAQPAAAAVSLTAAAAKPAATAAPPPRAPGPHAPKRQKRAMPKLAWLQPQLAAPGPAAPAAEGTPPPEAPANAFTAALASFL